MTVWQISTRFELDDHAVTGVVADLARSIEYRGGRLVEDVIQAKRVPAEDDAGPAHDRVSDLDEQRRRRRAGS